MADFTVIGFWPDTAQRFATHVRAPNAIEAEIKCAEHHAGVTICGVIRGRHQCVDKESHLSCTSPYDQ